jgi:uncharacterized alkaline shock family protein YloU
MIKYETHLGEVTISQSYFAKLVGEAVSSCYGVVNMVPKGIQRLRSKLLKRDFYDTGIRVSCNDHALVIDLHIRVMYGMNIGAISRSIVNKVTYVVEEATGIKVDRVMVHVDELSDD